MSSILNCPTCGGAIQLPSGSFTRLECPHCQAELSLQLDAVSPARVTRLAQVLPPRQVPVPMAAPVAAMPGMAHSPLTTAAPSSGSRSSTPRRRQPGIVSQLIGIVGGGLLGLAAGYWILNFFGGPRYNFLEVALPGVPHTQPGWVEPQVETSGQTNPVGDQSTPSQPGTLPAMSVGSSTPNLDPPVVPRPTLPEQPPAPAFPSYSSTELGRVLADAHATSGCEACKSTGFVKRVVVTGVTEVNGKRIESKAEKRLPCEVCGGKPTGQITPDVYATLCRLAQVVTFVDIVPGDAQFSARREAVQLVLLRAAETRDKQADLGRMAGYWLQNPQRASPGILCAGTIQEVGREGDFYWTRLVLFGLPEEVTVLSPSPVPLAVRDRVLIAGSVIDNPRQNLPGYQGQLPQVVWGGLPLRLPLEAR